MSFLEKTINNIKIANTSVKNIEDIKNMRDVERIFESQSYIANPQTVFTVYSAIQLGMPLLITGPAGTGKTEIAKVLSKALNLELIRVQCFEGIDFSKVLYEYDYIKQILTTNALQNSFSKLTENLSINEAIKKVANDVNFFDESFLIKRPLLKSITSDERKILLIDEIDKSDEEFEALLLELLSDFSISISEHTTINCDEDKKPVVILTSNDNRELSEALKRRCLYLYIDYPTEENESKIISLKADVSKGFALEVAKKVKEIRELNLKQKPSISESIVWAKSLMANLGEDAFEEFNKSILNETLGLLLKNQTDINTVRNNIV